MLSKADVGTYAYPPAGAAQPHGVSSIAGSAGTTKFTYDANGNLTTQTGATTRSLSWTIFDMPAAITYAGKTISFQYDADHHRVEQVAPEGTTYYLPDGELTPSLGAGPVWHVYVQADGQRVAETYGPTGALKHHYFHNDDQGSIGLITADGYVYGANGSIVQNELSDVFGQPRLPTGATDPSWGANDATKRRYINQEDLTDSHLIDLNARVYDPLFAKFLSPDPVIADQDDSQSWNAYAYAHNNPMSKDDPTGLTACPVRMSERGGCIDFDGAGGDDEQAAKSQTFLVTPGSKLAQLIHAAAGGDSAAAKKLWAAGVTDFSEGNASYSLQASIGGGLANGGSGEERDGPAQQQEQKAEVGYGETAGLLPAKAANAPAKVKNIYDPSTWDPASTQQLQDARQNIMDISDRNSNVKKSTASDNPIEQQIWNANMDAAGKSNGSMSGKYFFIRQDGVGAQHPSKRAGYGQGTPIRSYGPFRNVGGGDVPRGSGTYIDIYDK
jgi:RHS repeat-associated protein